MIRRSLVLLYAGLAYALFLGVILYAIGFMANSVVPKGIDQGPSARRLAVAIAVDVALLALFALQHTVMARGGFKRWFVRFVPHPVERSTFVALTSLILALTFWLWQPISGVVWATESPLWGMALTGVSLVGWALVFYSSFLIDHFELFGLRQGWLYFRGYTYTPPVFVKRSLYNHVRHPLMLGFLIAFWATPVMTVGHLLFSGVMTAYIFLGVAMEERDLMRAHGASYEQYRQTTPMIIPLLCPRVTDNRLRGVGQRAASKE